MSLTQTSQQLERSRRFSRRPTDRQPLLKLEPRDRAGEVPHQAQEPMRRPSTGCRDGLLRRGPKAVAADLDRIYRISKRRPPAVTRDRDLRLLGHGLYERVELPSVYRSRLVWTDRADPGTARHARRVGRLLTVVLDRTSAGSSSDRLRRQGDRGRPVGGDPGGKFHSDRHGAPGMGEHTTTTASGTR